MNTREAMKKVLPALCVVLVCCSCAPTIATQRIPVSTNPSGAQALVDGKLSCTTPCTVEMTRNQDHILTLQKEGYRQHDVPVRREYQSETALVNAINSGVNSGTFFNNAAMGLNSAVMKMNSDRSTGEAYALVPTTVSVTLVPAGGFPSKSTEGEAAKSLGKNVSPLDVMDASDEHMLESSLETSATGHPSVWTNDKTGFSFAVEPEDSRTENGVVVRNFRIGAQKGAEKVTRVYPAYRAGRGEWVVGNPPQGGEVPAAGSDRTGSRTASEYRALTELPWPVVSKEKTLKDSSHTTSRRNPDGSVSTETKGSSTKVGIGVSPGSVLGILDALKSLEK
ncbi:MAG: PEGA domain-containing protein [Deltaproteobacteria bacterium]|nr:PEGA domain-containing protein [Deltaproteobacteria bacterium]